MKQLLVIAIALASTNAFASRARVNSLANSAHVADTQSIYSNPAKMFLFGDFVNLESGSTATLAKDANTEGLLVRSMGDAKMGLSLGHKSLNASAVGLRQIIGFVPSAPIEQQNPIELSYGMKNGDMTWAGTLVYSNFNDKAAETKETSTGIRFGVLTGAWDAALGLGLVNTVTNKVADYKFKGTMGLSLDAGYTMDSLYAFGGIALAGAKLEQDSTGTEMAKVDQTKITVGVVNSHKKDGNEYFYGAKLVQEDTKEKVSDKKDKSTTLPVVVGLEAEATSWLALRGSLTQSVLIDTTKEEIGGATTDTSPGANNTVASIGAGLKFNKVTVDGALSGLVGGTQTQDLDGNQLLTTVGLTYMF